MEQSFPKINPWIVAIVVMFATFLEVLDTTVVNVSLPHIAGSLSATTDEATWALTSHLVANAIILPVTGWVGEIFWAEASAGVLCGRILYLFVFLRVSADATAAYPLSLYSGRLRRWSAAS